MLSYFYKLSDNNFIYSCDMLRFRLHFSRDLIEKVALRFSSYERLDVTIFPLRLSSFSYRQLFKVDYEQSSMTVGVGFNGTSTDSFFDGFLEVNPNKCFSSNLCIEDIKYIFSCCWGIDLVRWDLAIDIPAKRYLCKLIRNDRRTYSLIKNSSEDLTEYLGQTSTIGRVKLYNKSKESNLDYDLTRLEVTLPDLLSDKNLSKLLPEVRLQSFQQSFPFEFAQLNDTDRVLVELLRDSEYPDLYLKRLGRGKRSKLEKYIYYDCEPLRYSITTIFQVYNYYKMFLGY